MDSGMTKKEWMHKLVDVIDNEYDQDTVIWLLKAYAARSLNHKNKEDKSHEES